MNVTFNKAETLGNRPFKAGVQVIPDHLAGNQKFKQLVKSGAIIVHSRDEAAQKMQVTRDASNRAKAELHRQAGKALDAIRAMPGTKPHDVTEAAKPGTAQKIADAQAAKAAT